MTVTTTPTIAVTVPPTGTMPSREHPKRTTTEERNERNERLTERRSHPTTKRKRDPDRFMTEFAKKVRDMKELYLTKRQKNQGDNKRCMEFMDTWFPVTKTTGETEESVAQISKLKYVPAKPHRYTAVQKEVGREVLGKYFVGLVVKTDGKE